MSLVGATITPVDSVKPIVNEKCLWRRVIGADMWVRDQRGTEQALLQAPSGESDTDLPQVAALAGTYSKEASRRNKLAGPQLRFLARRNDVHLMDEAIVELVGYLVGRMRWSELVKLEELDCAQAFTEIHSL